MYIPLSNDMKKELKIPSFQVKCNKFGLNDSIEVQFFFEVNYTHHL